MKAYFKGDTMNLGHLSKTEIWKFEIEEKQIGYKEYCNYSAIVITFTDNKFIGIKWPFTGCYTLEQLDIIAEAIAKAHEIEKSYEETP